jgi:hypothetical protein
MNCQISRLFFSFSLLLCTQIAEAAFDDIQRIYRQAPQLNQFEICQGGGCANVFQIELNDADWQPVATLFAYPVESAEEERARVSQAIGLLESVVGHKTGTSEDRAGTFDNSDYTGQQDCNDEAINTTTYLRLLKQAGFMSLHEIEDMRTRNFFFTGWPHTTAVIHEIASGERFAVDSWFYDNGHPATIVPFNVWKANYQPEDSPIGKSRKDE